MKVNSRKVAVIGCGFVGSSSAFALMQSGLFSEMVLIDADTKRAEGEAMDISHGISFARPMQIYAGNYDDITDFKTKLQELIQADQRKTVWKRVERLSGEFAACWN